MVQIYISQIGEVEADEINLGANYHMMISDPAKDFYKDLDT